MSMMFLPSPKWTHGAARDRRARRQTVGVDGHVVVAEIRPGFGDGARRYRRDSEVLGAELQPHRALDRRAVCRLGVLVGHRVLICDRNRKWTPAARRLLDASGIRVAQTPFQAPNANAYAERFVRSMKDKCLSRVIPLGERHLRRTINQFVEHYDREQNHQGLGNELIDSVRPVRTVGGIRRRERLGGLLNYYYRAA